MKTSSYGIALLKEFEGRSLKAYQCSASVWTICDGITAGVKEGDTATNSECDKRLANEIRKYEAAVWTGTVGNVTQTEFDSFVCLAWNIGIAGFLKSTVLKAHNKGDKLAASRAFGLWNKVNGKANKGLTRRRAREAALYLSEETVTEDMPQVVDVEKPLTSSTTMITGSIAGVATATQLVDQVVKLKTGVDGMGDWLIPALLVITLIAVGWVIYERWQNRNRGSV